MKLTEEIVASVYAAVDEVNLMLPDDRRIAKDPGTVLLGAAGTLSSIEFVNLIVAAEGQIEDRLGRVVALADERAMSLRNSPFRTLASLAEYAGALVAERHDG